jgi:hypothetical protein
VPHATAQATALCKIVNLPTIFVLIFI